MRSGLASRLFPALALLSSVALVSACDKKDNGDEDTATDTVEEDVATDTAEDTTADTPADTPADTVEEDVVEEDTVTDTAGDATDTTEVTDVVDEDAVGTATCAETLTCVQGCTDEPCQNACLADACPAAMTQMLAIQTCMTTNCATECADPSDAACGPCIGANCMTEITACMGGTC